MHFASKAEKSSNKKAKKLIMEISGGHFEKFADVRPASTLRSKGRRVLSETSQKVCHVRNRQRKKDLWFKGARE
jgi:hypothetical protein